MTNHVIDNSASDLKKVVLWQYDKAWRLLSILDMMKKYYDAAVTHFWDNWRLHVLDIDHCDDFGASVWGILLGVSRPFITDEVTGIHRVINIDTYRRILKAVFFRFKCSCAYDEIMGRADDTSEDNEILIGYLQILFSVGSDLSKVGVRLKDNMDMSIVYEKNEPYFSQMDKDQQAIFTQLGDEFLIYPAGIRYNTHKNTNIFALQYLEWSILTYQPNTTLMAGRYYRYSYSIWLNTANIERATNTGWDAVSRYMLKVGSADYFQQCTYMSYDEEEVEEYSANRAYEYGSLIRHDAGDGSVVYMVTDDVTQIENTGWTALTYKIGTVSNTVCFSDKSELLTT